MLSRDVQCCYRTSSHPTGLTGPVRRRPWTCCMSYGPPDTAPGIPLSTFCRQNGSQERFLSVEWVLAKCDSRPRAHSLPLICSPRSGEQPVRLPSFVLRGVRIAEPAAYQFDWPKMMSCVECNARTCISYTGFFQACM